MRYGKITVNRVELFVSVFNYDAILLYSKQCTFDFNYSMFNYIF